MCIRDRVCDYPSSVGSFRSHYTTVKPSFTDAFLPSLLRNTLNLRPLRQLCYRTSQTVETYLIGAIIATSQFLHKGIRITGATCDDQFFICLDILEGLNQISNALLDVYKRQAPSDGRVDPYAASR